MVAVRDGKFVYVQSSAKRQTSGLWMLGERESEGSKRPTIFEVLSRRQSPAITFRVCHS